MYLLIAKEAAKFSQLFNDKLKVHSSSLLLGRTASSIANPMVEFISLL